MKDIIIMIVMPLPKIVCTGIAIRPLSHERFRTRVRVRRVLTFNGVQWDLSHDAFCGRATQHKRRASKNASVFPDARVLAGY